MNFAVPAAIYVDCELLAGHVFLRDEILTERINMGLELFVVVDYCRTYAG